MEQPKWRKWIRAFGLVILILTALLYIIIAFSNPNGKAYAYDDKHTIYYTDDQLDYRLMKSIGDSLTRIGLFTPDRNVVMQVLFKPEQGDTIHIAYIVKKEQLTAEAKEAFRTITRYLYPLLRCHTKILFKDEKFKLIDQMHLD